MKLQFLLPVFIILLPGILSGQDYPNVPPAVQDTIFLKTPLTTEPLSLFDIPGIRDNFTIQPLSGLTVPAFDISRYLKPGWRIITSPASSFFPAFAGLSPPPGIFFPFGGTGSLFSEATFSLNNKLTIGGNSFGIRSLFAPLPGISGTNQYDLHGATLFMEYKVSKNFRIGAGITVTDGPGIR